MGERISRIGREKKYRVNGGNRNGDEDSVDTGTKREGYRGKRNRCEILSEGIERKRN